MSPKLIDLKNYALSGEGANGKSYNSIADDNEMIKLYNVGYDISSIVTELEEARKVYDKQIPSPRPGELITDGERIGIRFFKIPNKTSYARAIADNPELLEPLTKEFAKMCRELHAFKCKDGEFADANNQFLELLSFDTAFNKEEKAKIAKFISEVPNPKTALHGDMHFGNAVISGPVNPEDKNAKRDLYWIDLGYFAMGNPLYDLGMLYLICIVDEDDFIFENFHFHKDVAERFWPIFITEYFDGKFTVEEANKLVKPYAAIKSLLVEHNVGDFLFPQFEKLFRETILQ